MINTLWTARRAGPAIVLGLAAASLAGCNSLGASGPARKAILQSVGRDVSGGDIRVVDVTADTARRLSANMAPRRFAEVFGESGVTPQTVGQGDTIDIEVWEAPPAVLFGNAMANTPASLGTSLAGAATGIARSSPLPQQIVGDDGTISVPFAGRVPAAGRTAQAIARDIERRLAGKAHDPQVIVRRVENVTSTVTVVGDVAQSNRLRLTSKGERLLDAIAGAGGTRQPLEKSSVQIARDGQVVAMPLQAVIGDPGQNIRLRPDDVVTVLYQPYGFTALGAVGKSAEVPFEATGLSLSQALGRVGGLDDNRSDPRGVFVFRFENAAALDPVLMAGARTMPDGRVPVIYRIDMRDPASLFVAQTFPIRDKDLLYISNAPAVDFQKFLGIVSSTVFSVIGVANTVR